jgi:hypothetical protein
MVRYGIYDDAYHATAPQEYLDGDRILFKGTIQDFHPKWQRFMIMVCLLHYLEENEDDDRFGLVAPKIIDAFKEKGISDFLPHTLRVLRMMDRDIKVNFVAKDSTYYWALDDKANPSRTGMPREDAFSDRDGLRLLASLDDEDPLREVPDDREDQARRRVPLFL